MHQYQGDMYECEDCQRMAEIILRNTDRMAQSRDSIVALRELVKKYRGLFKLVVQLYRQLVVDLKTKDEHLQHVVDILAALRNDAEDEILSDADEIIAEYSTQLETSSQEGTQTPPAEA